MRPTTDSGARGRLIAAGLERAALFSWDRSARLTDAAMGQVLEQDEPIVPRGVSTLPASFGGQKLST